MLDSNKTTRFLRTVGTLVLIAFAAACSDSEEVFAPTFDDLAGTYVAETFTTTTDGEVTDVLAQGGSIQLTLREDGTTTGQTFVPEGDEGGADLNKNLSGTYTFNETDKELMLDLSADTFVRDTTFSVVRAGNGVGLEGEYTREGSDTTTRVVLVRSSGGSL